MMEKVRTVLFIAPLPPPVTGQSVACEALCEELIRRGVEVVPLNINKRSLRSGNGTIGRFWEILLLLFRLALMRRDFDLVYFTPAESLLGNAKDLAVFRVLGRMICKTFIHMHGGAGMRELLSERHPKVKAANANFLSKVSGAIVLGERLRSVYEGVVPMERIHVVRNFAHDDLFSGWREIRKKLSNNATLRVLYLSNLLPGKGYDDLLEAVLSLPPQVTSRLSVDFAGGFESEKHRVEFLRRISAVPFIKYHGLVGGGMKRELLVSAHVFCLPTYYPYEGQPISILEAYASGCAVITTDHSGILDIFEPEKNGILVKKRQPESIAEAIVRFMGDPVLLRRTALVNAREARMTYRRRHHLSQLCKVLGVGELVS